MGALLMSERHANETPEQFAERIRAKSTAPTWAELRMKADHADDAYRFLSSAPFNGDAEMARVMVDAATVHATLAWCDKVDELVQTMRHLGATSVEAVADISQTIERVVGASIEATRENTETYAQIIELRRRAIRGVA